MAFAGFNPQSGRAWAAQPMTGRGTACWPIQIPTTDQCGRCSTDGGNTFESPLYYAVTFKDKPADPNNDYQDGIAVHRGDPNFCEWTYNYLNAIGDTIHILVFLQMDGAGVTVVEVWMLTNDIGGVPFATYVENITESPFFPVTSCMTGWQDVPNIGPGNGSSVDILPASGPSGAAMGRSGGGCGNCGYDAASDPDFPHA